MPMVTKLERDVIYYEGVPPIKFHKTLIMRSCEILWLTETLYLHYHSTYGSKAWHDIDLEQLPPIKLRDHIISWPCKTT